MSTTTTTQIRSLEPFPIFVDRSRPSSPLAYNSKISHTLSTIEPTYAIPEFRRRSSISNKVSKYVWLRYHQYEVTFGLYMMTFNEKVVLNTIVLAIFGALFYGVFFGLEPFMVRCVCRLLYYFTGGYERAEELCT